tara:strand:- start:799 stop:963 length:165 start_codon:yes stop_codon:yes gene_type:complete
MAVTLVFVFGFVVGNLFGVFLFLVVAWMVEMALFSDSHDSGSYDAASELDPNAV